MPVCVLEHLMPYSEFLEWREFYVLENEDHEKAVKEAKNKAKSKGRR
jgi:hypothetical protein